MRSILTRRLGSVGKSALTGNSNAARNVVFSRSLSSRAGNETIARGNEWAKNALRIGTASALLMGYFTLASQTRADEAPEVKEAHNEQTLQDQIEEQTQHQDEKATEQSEQPKGESEEGESGEGEKKQSPDAVHYKYVIVGSGAAGYAALGAILFRDADAKVLFVGAEPSYPYSRPPLSKSFWKTDDPDVATNLQYKDWNGNTQRIYFADDEYYKDPRVTFLPNHNVVDLDVTEKALLLDDGRIIEYSKCLLATGGSPRQLPAANGVPNVTTFRTIEDFQKLDKIAREVKHITVVGGGFLGSELAWGISNRGVKVTQVFPEAGTLATSLPQYLSEFVTNKAVEAGIDVHTGRLVNAVTQNGERLEVTLDDGKKIDTDHIVVAVGIAPSTDLGKLDLEIDTTNGGIVANSELAARSDVYVAGDVASFYDKVLGTRRRIEHYDHALMSGQHAAMNMVHNTRESYMYQPMFWSDLGEYGFEAVGDIDSRLQTIGVWEKPEGEITENTKPDYKRGIVYYLNKDNVLVGVLTWNIFGKLEAARVNIRKKTQITSPSELKNMISIEVEEHH